MQTTGSGPQQSIVIVGGGTAGWLTANLLDSLLNLPGQQQVQITLIESSNIGRIGVGEATVPTLIKTLIDLRIDEATFMRQTHATFKHAIRFQDWLHAPGQGSGPSHYYHAFENFSVSVSERSQRYYSPMLKLAHSQGIDISTFWWHRAQEGRSEPFALETGIQPYLCEAMRSPKAIGDVDYRGDVPYAYHLSADDFANLLAEIGQRRLITRIEDDVIGVEMTPNGLISAVKTKQHGRLPGDFFVDCTGFAGLLIERALRVPFLDYRKYLRCDRAIAMPIEHTTPTRRPYTSATALENGWAWEIDLTTRSGTGYVYASEFIDDDAAEDRLRQFLGVRASPDAGRRLQMRVGRRTQFWSGNCVAIGLSAGFIEPLESTGIYLIEAGARFLADLFAGKETSKRAVATYNESIARQFDDIRDFVVLHYCLSKRQDSKFWAEVQRRENIPDSLAARLELWREYMPSAVHFNNTNSLFEDHNYRAILFGMDWKIERPAGRATLRKPVRTDEMADIVFSAAESALENLPLHTAVLNEIHRTIAPPAKAASLSLTPGLPVVGLAAARDRIELCKGSIPCSDAGLGADEYHKNALIPVQQWAGADDAQFEILKTDAASTDLGFISLVRPPRELIEPLQIAIREQLPETVSGETVLWNGKEHPSLSAAAAGLVSLYADTSKPSRQLGLLVNRSGYLTITGDKFDKKRIGLHLDGWSELSSHQRDDAPNRLCINLGEQPRRLLYVNLPLRNVIAHLERSGQTLLGLGPTDIGRAFLRAFPDYPVVSVEVHPGEAYVAPTENIIHDGASDRMTAPDITLTILGHFLKERCQGTAD
jgi:tryptophan 7-halogenase